MANIGHIELPLAPHALEAQRLADLRAAKPEPNWGLLIDLKTVPGSASFMDSIKEMPATIEYRCHTLHKDGDVIVYEDNTWYIQYRREDCPYPEGQLITTCKTSYIKILAQVWFGMTYAGIDTFMYKFSEFVGIWLDSHNIHEHFNSFASYVAKECDTKLDTMRHVIRFIFKLK